MKFRLHVIGLPFSSFNRIHGGCAFSSKLFNFARMMHEDGHTVFCYGAEGGNPPCTEHVTIMSAAEQKTIYGEHDFSRPYNYTFDANHRGWQIFNLRGAAEIMLRAEQKDIVCIMGGHANAPLVTAIEPLVAVEIGIGYPVSFLKYRVFESVAHLSGTHRLEHPDTLNVSNYWTVIPTFFLEEEFPFCPPPTENTYGFLGRIIHQKGVNTAVAACDYIGAKLLVAGTGATMVGNELRADDTMVYKSDNIEFLGHVNQEQRIAFFKRIKALFVPTIYLEPLGYVAMEAQLCGVPVIAANAGGMVDTVEHGKTGYRCHVLRQYIKAAQAVDKLDRQYIHERAHRLWSLKAIAPRYAEYFLSLHELWENGWFETKNLAETNLAGIA
jgi:glycosyltransferase involved in cell wall biosynthesis